MFSQQCLEVLYHTATNLPNRLFSSDFVLGNMVETEVRVFKLFPLQPGTQQCSLPGILPVCLCVHTSILARQLPGWGCWKQVNLPRLASLWALVCEACINFESPLTFWCLGRNIPLQWGHNESDCISNHRRLDCLLNRLFRRRSEKTSKLRVREFTVEFPAHRASNTENVSIWWRHHVRGNRSIPWLHYLGL